MFRGYHRFNTKLNIRGNDTGARSTLLWSADPREGNARDVYAPGTVPKHKSFVLLKRVGQVFKVLFRKQWLKSPSMNFGASGDIESSL